MNQSREKRETPAERQRAVSATDVGGASPAMSPAIDVARKWRRRDSDVESTDLLAVALIAAQCCIDLDANLKTAHEEYMRGDIPAGAFRYVHERHANMHAALHAAGFTEKHPFFGFPIRPDISANA